MLDREQARRVALTHLGQPPGADFEYVIMDESTIERPACFVFFYQSDRYVASRNPLDGLAGNAPILVDRRTGCAHDTGTAYPIGHYIQQFEANQ